jgi:hypothetical protein
MILRPGVRRRIGKLSSGVVLTSVTYTVHLVATSGYYGTEYDYQDVSNGGAIGTISPNNTYRSEQVWGLYVIPGFGNTVALTLNVPFPAPADTFTQLVINGVTATNNLSPTGNGGNGSLTQWSFSGISTGISATGDYTFILRY